MRNSIIYAVSGALVGLAIFLLLSAIAIPSYDSYFLDINQYQEFKYIQEVFSVVTSDSNIFLLLLFIIPLTLTWLRFSGVINTQFRNVPFSRPDRPVRGWLLLIFSGILFWLSLFSFSGLVESMGSIISYSEIFISILGCSFSLFLLSDKGLGELASGALTFNWKQYANTLLRGFVFSVFCITVFFILINKLVFILIMIVVEVYDPSMEHSLFGYIGILVTLSLLSSLLFFITFGMAPLFAASKANINTYLLKSKPALITLGITSLVIIVLTPVILTAYHYKFNSLTEAAGLDSISPYKLKLVQFCNKASCKSAGNTNTTSTGYKVSDWKNTVHGYSMFAGESEVSLNINSIKRLETYLLTEGKYSIYRKSAINTIPEIYKSLWQPYEAMHANDFLINEGQLPFGPSIIWPMIQLHWLAASAPINEKNKQDLEMLSDSKRFYFGGPRLTTSLGNAWMRFGEATKAEHFYSLANNASQEETNGQIPEKRTLNTVSNGVLKGIVKVKNNTPAGIRVGIFKLSDSEKKYGNQTPSFYGAVYTIGSRLLGDSGEFIFKNLSNDNYYLALLVPDTLYNENTKIITQMPVVINIDSTTHQVNVGEIRIE